MRVFKVVQRWSRGPVVLLGSARADDRTSVGTCLQQSRYAPHLPFMYARCLVLKKQPGTEPGRIGLGDHPVIQPLECSGASVEVVAPGSELPVRPLLSLFILLDRRQRYVRFLGEFTLEQAHLLSSGAQLFDEHGAERDRPSSRLRRAHDWNMLPWVTSPTLLNRALVLHRGPGHGSGNPARLLLTNRGTCTLCVVWGRSSGHETSG